MQNKVNCKAKTGFGKIYSDEIQLNFVGNSSESFKNSIEVNQIINDPKKPNWINRALVFRDPF